MADLDLVIFDCDGTLVDSEFLAAQIEAEQLGKVGYKITPEEFAERFAGMTTKEILFAIEKEADVPLPASLLDTTQDELNRRLPNEVEPIWGVHEALDKIGVPMCVCSNSPQSRLDGMLLRTRLNSFFGDFVYSSRDIGDGKPKPAPDVFLHAIDKHDAEADFTIVIEDSEAGVKGAIAAGARVIGFTGGTHTFPGHADKLMDAGAETVVNRMADLPTMIEALSGWKELK